MTAVLWSFTTPFVMGGAIAWMYATLHTRRPSIKNPVTELLFSECLFVALGVSLYLTPGKDPDPLRGEWMSFVFYGALAGMLRFVYLRRRGRESNPSPVAD